MNHKITNCNIKDVSVEMNIKQNFPAGLDFCYTDPPWGEGNLKYWKTMHAKNNGVQEQLLSQDELEHRFVDLIVENVNNYAFIVYGKKQVNSCVEKLRAKKEVSDIQVYEKRYKSGSAWLENVVICIALRNAEILDWSDLKNKDGLVGLKYVCEKFQDKYTTCLELFVGVGYYLKMLNDHNFTVCGNEMNTTRLRKALSKIK